MQLRHLTLVFWIAVFLLAGELALEWRANKRGYGTLMLSPGGLSSANSSSSASEAGFGPTPDFPFRSRVVAPAKPSGTTRIWIASASYAEDRRHAAAQIFPVLLEDELRARGHDVQVINASRNAYSLGGAARVLREEGATWSPDLVVVYHYSNDLDELAPRYLSAASGGAPNAVGGESEAELAAEEDEGVARTEHDRLWPSRLMEATTAYAQAKNQFKARLVALRLLAEALPPELVAELELRVLAVEAIADKLGAQLVLCRFACSQPSSAGGHLPTDFRNNLFRYNSHLSERAWRDGVDVYNALLERIGEREGLPVIALDERLAGRADCYRDFCHLTETGHRTAALALADLLEPLVVAREEARATGAGDGK